MTTIRESLIDCAVRRSLRRAGGMLQNSDIREFSAYWHARDAIKPFFSTGDYGFIIAHVRAAFFEICARWDIR